MADGRRILVAERDETTAAFLLEALAADGFTAAFAAGAPAALTLADEWSPALLIVGDLARRRDALELIAAVRAGHAGAVDPRLPVLALSAVRGELELLRLFGVGADDVVAKPFSYPQLRARIDALLRRAAPLAPGPPIRVGALEIDAARRLVRVDGHPVLLCRREYELLLHLAADPERVFDKHDILRDVWGYRARSLTRTLDATAGRLRRKLAPGGRYVVNVWGVGYRLVAPVEDAEPVDAEVAALP